VRHAEPRAGELRHSCLDAARLRSLGGAPETALETGLGATYEWIEANTGTESVAS
jgi:nucleoside-diphosphate-sugar epimerase